MDDARFRVRHTLILPSRNLFFVLGDVAEGVVRIGMVVEVEPTFRNAIHAVEFADYRAERRADVALGFRYRDVAELARWQAIPWEGMTLEIPADPIPAPASER